MKNHQTICIFGASGGIGKAFVKECNALYPKATIHAISRAQYDFQMDNVISHSIDYTDEDSISSLAQAISADGPLDMVIVATGFLHDGEIMPEKSLRDLSADKFHTVFAVNTITPALIAKHFLPKLKGDSQSIFAALSARVGSISDNQMGGWYAYRASKAALNMIIKNAAIEVGRRNKKAIIVSLHPGTVDTSLSKPFQSNVREGKLFTPEFSAQSMLNVLQGLTAEQSGLCFAWDGEEIEP